ncbi:MAG TPA: arginine--tRNA ligase [Burkholderiales bacterium]|nr:arginine--tRNA ligase [Burkholderiales bacterium]
MGRETGPFPVLRRMTAAPSEDARTHLVGLLAQALNTVAPGRTDVAIVLERPKRAGHGDYACSIALQLAKPLKRAPRDIAGMLVAAVAASPALEKAEVAGAGFINLFLTRGFKQQAVTRVLAAGAAYGHLALGLRKKVQVEFVSANPTGPLHVGHGRGAAYGASLANVLSAAGFDVTREYYVNDAGRQMDILALSTWLRYLQLCGIDAPFPGNAYQGDYVRTMAQGLRARHGEALCRGVTEADLRNAQAVDDDEVRLDRLIALAREKLGHEYLTVHRLALNEQLEDCRSDLSEFGVTFDRWFFESSLYESGLIERAIGALEERGHIYRKDGARWFRSSAFGDEKDRVVQRENGQYTYFASDIAYHLDKSGRGYDVVIDVWGADHHGYILRVKGALAALGLNPEQLTIALVQFAVLYRNGQKVSMSTRAGEFVTLRELRREVGNDAARFFYVLRKSDQHLDFDLDLAKSRTNENPVYYVQYAHARICSVIEQWGGDPGGLSRAEAERLDSEQELALLSRLMEYPEIIESAASELSPHVIAFYLRELTADFHSYYNANRILVEEEGVKLARLALVAAVRQVLRNGLGLLGVSAPEKM